MFHAIVAAIFVVAIWYITESQAKRIYLQSTRNDVTVKLDQIRANLELYINSDLYLTQGLAAALSLEPDMRQERFHALATELFRESKNLRNIATAPNLVIQYTYPPEGNETTVGLDYNSIIEQRDDVIKARDMRKMVLSGPQDLVQGGQAFFGRYPIFDATSPDDVFWGILVAVVDLDRLYAASGIEHPDLNVALKSNDTHKLFFGERAVIEDAPVQLDVRLPNGSWTIFATPKDGWGSPTYNVWFLRSATLLAALLIVIPILASIALFKQRQTYIEVLSEKKADLIRQSRRLHLALEAADVGVWEYDARTNTIIWDARMNKIYGYALGFNNHDFFDWESRIHPDDRARAISQLTDSARMGHPCGTRFRLRLPNGDIRYIRSLSNRITSANREIYVGVNWDITDETILQDSLKGANEDLHAKNAELEEANARVEFLALHDPLTELPNRRYLGQLLDKHSREFVTQESYAAVLQIDLDRFKAVNDTWGHIVGDEVLVQIASAISNVISEQDHVFRLGGDEFVVFITRPNRAYFQDETYLRTLAEHILKTLSRPFDVPNGTITVGASIGIATDAILSTTPETLLRDADVALYSAKSTGRGRYQICSTELRRSLDLKSAFMSELKTALKEGQIVPHYQPQYRGKDLSICGAEALARWNHPTRGVLTPSAFLEEAKELGKDAEIDRAILLHVLKDRAQWLQRGIEVPRISVNVSAKQISNPDFVNDLAQLNIPRGALCFELVESIFMDDDNRILAENVAGIKQLGIEIEIDDFGTGFASIIALQKLSPKRLKIDNQLVSPITSSSSAHRIVSSLIEIASSLNIQVIAEGVECDAHTLMLQKLGCHGLQGYGLSRPLPSDRFAKLLHKKEVRANAMT
ncbi:EAL domain-containing protein [Falsihalocynthiibacter sp. SS001]|uniref:bifunctional diguanylate cyclase/phosphodiesterase n=1 Tax=Falsihalocynthiibacter sp. SS001 TaxID=3349698 RepID=UPI0036D2DDD0